MNGVDYDEVISGYYAMEITLVHVHALTHLQEGIGGLAHTQLISKFTNVTCR